MKSLKEIFTKTNKPNYYCNSAEISEGKEGSLIKIVPVGNFPEHPNGAHEVTATHIKQMAANLNCSGTDILFDFGHDSLWNSGAKAAGWSDKGEVTAKEDGLYIKYPEFTEEARIKVSGREYRYFSPVYTLNQKSKEGKDTGAALLSVGLTNTPYFNTEIEHIRNSFINNKTRSQLEKLKSFLGLSANASAQEMETSVEKFINSSGLNTLEEALQLSDNNKTELSEIRTELENIKAKLTDNKGNAEVLVNSAVNSGKILPAEKDLWLKYANDHFETTEKILNSKKVNSVIPHPITISDENKEEISEINKAAGFLKELGR